MTITPELATAYVVLRSLGAAIVAARLHSDEEVSGWTLAGQIVTDVAAALFVIGVTRAHLRTAVGGWWVPLFAFTIGWEARRLVAFFNDAFDPPLDNPEEVVADPVLASGGALLGWGWQALAVGPPLAAGFMLAFDGAFPGYWVFPGR